MAGDDIILGFDVSDPEQKEKLVTHLRDEYLAGKSMKETLQVADYQLEQVYAIAYRKYQAGEYKEASEIFQYLLFFDDRNYKFLLGYAAAMHKLHDYYAAMGAYQMAALQAPKDPVPLFHLADCYINTGNPGKAAAALEMVIRMGTLDERYSELKERATLIKSALEKKGEKKPRRRRGKKKTS